MHELGAQVRRQPRRHEVDAGDEGDVVGDGGRVSGGVEREGAPGRAAGGVTAHAACLQDRLHGGRELAHRDVAGRDVAAQVAGRLRAELDPVGDQLEGEGHLVGGVHEPGDVDRPDVVVAGQHGGRHDGTDGVRVDGDGANEGLGAGGLLDGQLAGDGDVVGGAVGELGVEAFHRRGPEPHEGPVARLQVVVADAPVPQGGVRLEHLHVHHDLADAARGQIDKVDRDLAGHDRRGADRGPRQPAESLLDVVAGPGARPGHHAVQPLGLGVEVLGIVDVHHRRRDHLAAGHQLGMIDVAVVRTADRGVDGHVCSHIDGHIDGCLDGPEPLAPGQERGRSDHEHRQDRDATRVKPPPPGHTPVCPGSRRAGVRQSV